MATQGLVVRQSLAAAGTGSVLAAANPVHLMQYAVTGNAAYSIVAFPGLVAPRLTHLLVPPADGRWLGQLRCGQRPAGVVLGRLWGYAHGYYRSCGF